MSVLGHAVGFGVVTSVLIALSAVAFSLQYAVSSVANFAHGDILTVGAYLALTAQRHGANLPVSAVAGAAGGALFAFSMYRFLLQGFAQRATTRLVFTVAVTAGIALIVENGLALVYGNGNVNFGVNIGLAHRVGPFLWTTLDIVVIVAGCALLVVLYLVLRYTQFGKAVRAVSDNPALARASGVEVERTICATWAMAGFVAGAAGVALATSQSTFGPLLGAQFLLVTFAAAIIGGVGRVAGAALGALLIGMVTEISGSYLSSGYKQVAALTMLVLVILLRPEGLLRAQRAAA